MQVLNLLFIKKIQKTELVTEWYDEYDIDFTAKGKEDLTTMCNLGEGIYGKGVAKGMEQGIVRTVLKYVKTRNFHRRSGEMYRASY